MATLVVMTTADDYLESVKQKNPKLFAADKIQITPDQLGRVIKTAWIESRRSMAEDTNSPMPDFMRGLFR